MIGYIKEQRANFNWLLFAKLGAIWALKQINNSSYKLYPLNKLEKHGAMRLQLDLIVDMSGQTGIPFSYFAQIWQKIVDSTRGESFQLFNF